MGFKEFWESTKKKAPGLIGRGLIGAATTMAPAIDSILAPYTAGVPVVSTAVNAGIGYLKKHSTESAWDRQNKKNELWNRAHSESLTGDAAKAYVKQRLGKKSTGYKMLQGAAKQDMIKLPEALGNNISNGHAAIGYSISPTSNRPSVGSKYNNKPRIKHLG